MLVARGFIPVVMMEFYFMLVASFIPGSGRVFFMVMTGSFPSL